MTQKEFREKREAAMENIRKMNSRSKAPPQKTPPTPPPSPPPALAPNRPLGLNGINVDPDTALIIGLIILLSGENCDKFLLYALIYILL